MKVTFFEKYLNRRFESVGKNLRAYGEDMSPERLHSLRIDVKKIRAVLSFVEKTYQKEYDTGRLLSVHKRAGELREVQRHIELLVAHADPSQSVLSQLENQKNGRKGAFKKNSALYLDEVSQVQENVTLPAEKLTGKKVRKYLGKRLLKAGTKIEEAQRENVHAFRKEIKKVLYLYKALSKKLKKKVKLDTGYLEKLQKKAGDWHDTHETLLYIREQPEFTLSEQSWQQLKAKEEKQFENLVKKVKKKRLSVEK